MLSIGSLHLVRSLAWEFEFLSVFRPGPSCVATIRSGLIRIFLTSGLGFFMHISSLVFLGTCTSQLLFEVWNWWSRLMLVMALVFILKWLSMSRDIQTVLLLLWLSVVPRWHCCWLPSISIYCDHWTFCSCCSCFRCWDQCSGHNIHLLLTAFFCPIPASCPAQFQLSSRRQLGYRFCLLWFISCFD